MSLDKAIEHGKEHRKPYVHSKAIARSCRDHGSCEWCKQSRLHQKNRADEACRPWKILRRVYAYGMEVLDDKI